MLPGLKAPGRRRSPSKLAELAHQMRLVGIAAVGGDACPAAVAGSRRRHRPVQPRRCATPISGRARSRPVKRRARCLRLQPILPAIERDFRPSAGRGDFCERPGDLGGGSVRTAKLAQSRTPRRCRSAFPSPPRLPSFSRNVSPLRAQHVVQRDHAVGQLRHRHAEEAPCAERREIDLDAVRRAEGIDRHRPGEQAGGKAAVAVVASGRAAEPDRERLAEADDQRNVERGRLDLPEMPALVLAVAGYPATPGPP